MTKNGVREDVGEDVGIVECGLYAIVCVGETSEPPENACLQNDELDAVCVM